MVQFDVVLADPCWQFSDRLKMKDGVKRGAEDNYPVLDIEELKKIPVEKLAKKDGCILAMWCVGSMLTEALDLLKAWGFTHKQTFVWVKTKKEKILKKKSAKSQLEINDDILSFGMGHSFRQSHELCLIGINNTGVYKKLKNKSQRSVCFEENKGHSIKPEILQDRLELMFGKDCDKIELFARRSREGWICLGNEIDGMDIRDSIKLLTE
jgi:N6-adenosine-specific RNA methylase IME4